MGSFLMDILSSYRQSVESARDQISKTLRYQHGWLCDVSGTVYSLVFRYDIVILELHIAVVLSAGTASADAARTAALADLRRKCVPHLIWLLRSICLESQLPERRYLTLMAG